MARLSRVSGITHSAELDLFVRRLLLLGIGIALSLILSHTAFGATHNLLVSGYANRSNAEPLAGQTVSGNIYVYATPETGIAKVSFYLDDPNMSGSPRQLERAAPYDFAGTAKDATAFPLDTSQLASGSHTITALVALSGGGSEVVQGTFTLTSGTATSETTSASFSWVAPSARTDGSPLSLSELAGYRIYHGTDAKQLSLLVNIQDPTATTYTVLSLPAGTHYFAMTAYDVSGMESPESEVISKTIQ